jgi:hypothetical protein
MKRSLGFFVAGTVAGLLVAVVAFGGLFGGRAAPPPADAQSPIRWKMQTAWPLGVFPDDAAKLLVATID